MSGLGSAKERLLVVQSCLARLGINSVSPVESLHVRPVRGRCSSYGRPARRILCGEPLVRGAIRYHLETATNPVVGPGGFLSMHIGYGHVFIIDIADLTTCGFTIETIPAYTSSKQRNEIAQFGLKPNSHLYFPPGTFPLVVGVRTPSAIDDKGIYRFHS